MSGNDHITGGLFRLVGVVLFAPLFWLCLSVPSVAALPPVPHFCMESGDQLCIDCLAASNEPWTVQIAPEGLIYRSYLAGVKEPRFGTQWVYEQDEGWFMDSSLGGRVGIARYGTTGSNHPQGWQLDVAGAVFLRQTPQEGFDLVSSDFRIGVPLTYSVGRYQTKFGYYHLSSHLGDEYLLYSVPPPTRINFVRETLMWGHSYFVTDSMRVYFEAGWAFHTDGGSRPWEFQFGVDYSPSEVSGFWGSPFFAINGHLREDVDFGGNFTVQLGRQWRGHLGGPLIRVGLHYYNGKSPQFEFFNRFEQQFGFGFWYDF